MLLRHALEPRSVAVVGASENPHKVGGRPILYMKRYGYRGAIYPVNPARASVQGLRAFARLEELPQVPELAVVAVPGEEAVRAVEACARLGVRVAVVMASGFGEAGGEGRLRQERMVSAAAASGMRLIGPNCQGIANFASGVIANFSTIFHEVGGRDGPVAIVSQSGANSQAIYTLAREKGLGVRHVHATGNEADVTVADLAEALVGDEAVRLLLLYMESIGDPARLARAAELARLRDLPIVALKAGRTASGQRAASSHTGALATEDRIVDAFFERHGIWRVQDPHELVSAAELYLSGKRPRGRRLVFISNSGASCVMAADRAEERGIPLAEVSPSARAKLGEALPPFAGLDNPIDVTGALLGSPGLLGAVLGAVGEDAQSELLLFALPVAGTGYDLARLAGDLASFSARAPHAVALAAPQESVRAQFAAAGVPVFGREREAIEALAQLADHSALMRERAGEGTAQAPAIPADGEKFMNEAESLGLLSAAGLAVVEHRLCANEAEAREARRGLEGPLAVKACSRDVPHKSAAGLVALGVDDPVPELRRQREKLAALGARFEGVIVARTAPGGRELALGARMDPKFGPVVLVGDGGVYLEALKDFRLLMPPFGEERVLQALSRLRVAPLLAGLDVGAYARMAVRLGELACAWRGSVAAIDVNPLIVSRAGALAVDALIERAV